MITFTNAENKDMSKFITIENKTKIDIHYLKPGGKKRIRVDSEGTPLDYHWRRRLKDAKIDGCIKIIDEKKETVKDKKKTKKKDTKKED